MERRLRWLVVVQDSDHEPPLPVPAAPVRSTLRNIAVLALLAGGAGFALTWVARVTEDDVARNRLAAETRILRELAGMDVDAPVDGDLVLCERGQVIVRGAGRGYGGEFRIAVAVGANGRIVGVRVIDHQETPGFGDILDAPSAWLESFATGDVHAVTGATVTSDAVIQAVERIAGRVDLRTLCPS